MQLLVEIESKANGDAVRQAIEMLKGVSDAEEYTKPEDLMKREELMDALDDAHDVMVRLGQVIYRHADTSNPMCPLAAALDDLQAYLADNQVKERVDLVPKTPGDVMVFCSLE